MSVSCPSEVRTTFVRSVAPAWAQDGNLTYGGFFMINGDGRYAPVPKDAYFMAGAGGQRTMIIPLSRSRGGPNGTLQRRDTGGASFRKSLAASCKTLPQAPVILNATQKERERREESALPKLGES